MARIEAQCGRISPGQGGAKGSAMANGRAKEHAARADQPAGTARAARPKSSAQSAPSGRGRVAPSRSSAPLIGLYPGTFDPVTMGHLDIIARAAKLVDTLFIGVAINRDKGPLFTLEERVEMLEAECAALDAPAEILVRPFDTLLMNFAEDVGARVIVRGLRAVSDFEYEFQMVAMNQKLNSDIETVFFMADPTHQAIASRLVKEIARLGGSIDQFTTPGVAKRLKAKFGVA
jgi:pantetheine-phosphate adenylyltransferase